ncbi:MAG: bacillithiol biosynthesis deacetylase BshB1 [Blastocatellia bacterium]|nr:bacillithiol biosynthesis deacetylase BshB1 [Blastocatellia bacterium]
MEPLDILAIGSHPDDVEMQCAGTLLKMKARGYRTGVLDVTRGEMGTRGTPEIRAREAEKAAEIMGLDVRQNLELPDGHVWCNEESRTRLVRVIRALKPKIILTHYPQDPHPDHAHTAQLVREAAHLAHLMKYDGENGQERHFVNAVAHYLFPRTVTPTFLVDITEFHEQKFDAIRAHASQFYNPSGNDPETMLSGSDFFERLRAVEQYFGHLINARFAEAFVVQEALNVDDPVALLTRPMNPYS